MRGLTGDRLRREERYHSRLSLPDRYQLGFPDSMPRFHRFMVDRVGNLWVPRYEPIWSTEDRDWRVYDSEGVWLTTVTMPFELLADCERRREKDTCLMSVLEIGEDYMLIDHRDDLGVTRVRKYRLIKPS